MSDAAVQTDIEDVDNLGKYPETIARKASVETMANARLRTFVARIERLEEEKRDLSAAVTDIYTEVKSAGYDPKVLRKLIAERRGDPEAVAGQLSLLEVYRNALA